MGEKFVGTIENTHVHKTMLTAEFKQSPHYKQLAAIVHDVAPDLPDVLVDQAVWMHLKDPFLYKKLIKLEKEEARKQRKMQAVASLKQRQATSTEAVTSSPDDCDHVDVVGEVTSGLDDTVEDVVEHVHDVQGGDGVTVDGVDNV